MADILSYLFSTSGAWVWLVAAAAVGAFAYLRHDSFVITDFTYRFPVIGKLARYSRDYSETKRGGWLNVEATLCHDYARHVTALSKADFQRNIEYLRKAYDHGRKPMPGKIVALLVMLVVLEAIGFSYLLGSWMALESSENMRVWLTGAIVAVLAAILVWVTHSAGHQLYRTRLLRSCFQQFQAGMLNPSEEGVEADGTRPRVFSSEIISLNDDQSKDDRLPVHVQCANRVITRPDDVGSYAWIWIAAILVGLIAIISVVLRMETMHSADLLAAEFIAGGGDAGEGQQAAAAAARETAALASFAMLAIIFVVTQLVGMGVGYWYGFAGKQSHEAYRATGGCPDYDTYFAPVRRRMSIADLRLTTLHRLMERRLPHEINWTRDFLNFIREERERGATDLQDPTNLEGTPPGASAIAHPDPHLGGVALVATPLPEKKDEQDNPGL
jgi:hypothetical protein